jgi:hypothetical protein
VTQPLGTLDYCSRKIAPGSHPTFGPQNTLTFDQDQDQGSSNSPGEIMVTTEACPQPLNITNNPADDRNPMWAPPTFTGVPGVPPPN